jgi:DNA-binding transcriptional LysR family regulator
VDKFDAMHVFVRIVEKGSFSAVAKERGIGQPAVSKQISALEDELGTELIHRTSRSIALTDAGRDFYESALHILDDFENATSRIGRGQTAPKGLIRMSTKVRIFIEHLEKTFALCSPVQPTTQLTPV